jgi:hypothetical protein
MQLITTKPRNKSFGALLYSDDDCRLDNLNIVFPSYLFAVAAF